MSDINKESSPFPRSAFWKGVIGAGVVGVAVPFLSTLVFANYGAVLFVLTPAFIGFAVPVIAGTKTPLTEAQSIGGGLLALVVSGLFMILIAFEGLICIMMALPIAVVPTILGSFIGQRIMPKHTRKGPPVAVFVLLLLPPSLLTVESHVEQEHTLIPVTTSVDINATPETVWRHVVTFSELEPPTELLFKAGIAYPIMARIEGTGVGAIRYCDFSTGSFVEPIQVWEENRLLGFSVREQPVPMKELSPYQDIDPDHLHGYFVSVKGQFKLTALDNGKTRLEGTTWYYQKLGPEFYWNLWSNYIVHSIHKRVLNHIKDQAETAQTQTEHQP